MGGQPELGDFGHRRACRLQQVETQEEAIDSPGNIHRNLCGSINGRRRLGRQMSPCLKMWCSGARA